MGEPVRSIGGYEVVEKMGTGTVGTVYKARQVAMDRLVALKILNAKYAVDPSFVEGFIAEARTAGRINHPHICQVYDVGEEGGVYFFSMELVDGPTLEQVLKEKGRLPVAEALRIVCGVASALSAAHAHGLVHRDVKPGNIVLASSGAPKLVDLGVAKDVTAPGADVASGLVGTPYYMPPEQGQGKAVDIRSDIYALGATFDHLLVGRPPFTGPHPTAVMIKHASEPLTPPSELDPQIPREVSAVIEKMMAKKPGDRYADPEALVRDLDKALGASPSGPGLKLEPAAAAPATSHRKPTRRRAPVRTPRGGSVAVPVAVGGGAVLVLLVLAMLLTGGRDPALARAERDLARASALLAGDAPGATEEAARIAAGARRSLPATPEGASLRSRADGIIGRAEDRMASVEMRQLDRIVLAVADGSRDAEDAKAAVEGVRRTWEASSVSPAARGRVLERCSLALGKIGSLGARTAEWREPELGEAAREALESVGAALEEGSYAEAMRIIDDAVAEAGGHDRSALVAAKSKVRKRAEKGFSALMRDVQDKLDARLFVRAELDIKSARPRFAFGPYPEEIDARIAELRKIAAAGVADEELDAVPDEALDIATLESAAEPADEPEPQPEVAAAEEDDPDAQAAADAARQQAAADYFAKEGWTPEGGTWTLKKGVLKVVVPEDSRAKLVYKRKRVADFAMQFDARAIAGAGFRLQCRWADVAPVPGVNLAGVEPGRGYALYIGASEALLQIRGAPVVGRRWLRRARALAGEYQTWTRKPIAGSRWNRYVFQARGSRLAAVIGGRIQLTRGDETFQSGMVRFEFLEGSEVELRKLKIRTQ